MKEHRSRLAPLAAVLSLAVLSAAPALARQDATTPEKKEAAAPAASTPATTTPGSTTPAADEASDSAITFHGEVRQRWESWRNASDFSNTTSGPTDDTFDVAPWRVRFGALADLGHHITAAMDLQGVGVWGHTDSFGCFFSGDCATRDVYGTSAGTEVDLYQGWVNFGSVGGTNMDLKFGRQEIEFDRGLHFGTEPYYNGVSHDGVMAAWKWEKLSVHGFWIRTEENEFPPTSSVDHTDNELLGAHFSLAVGEKRDADLGYYIFHRIDRGDPGPGGRVTDTTIGARWGRQLTGATGWIWNLEGAWQEGDIRSSAASNMNHEAYVFEGSIGYNSDKSGADRSFWVGAYIASGDGDPNNNRSEAWVPLFEDVHGRLGDADIAPLTNILAANVGLKMAFREDHSFRAEYFQFARRKDEQASISPIFGVTLADACTTGMKCSTDLGREVDFDYSYRATENLTMGIAWAYFIPGGAIEDRFGTQGSTITGEHAAMRLALQVRARF